MKTVPFILIVSLALAGAIVAANSPMSQSRQAELLLGTALHQEEVEGNLEAAIKTYRKVLAEYSDNRPVAAKALLQIGQCYERLGKDEARKAYQQLISDYADQQEQAKLARVRLAALSRNSDSDRKPVFATRQVLAGPINNISLWSPSPDGKYLSFPSPKGLAVRDLETGVIRILTNDDPTGGGAEDSRWSPDGKYIAYDWDNGDYMDLRVISVKGGKSRILAEYKEGGDAQVFDWSPDSKKILTLRTKQDLTLQIALFSAEDGTTTVLKTFKEPSPWNEPWKRPQVMRFSRDGKYIAYDYPQEKGVQERDIFVISADGKREFPLVQHPADDRLLGWPPDGKSILFASDRTGSLDMWIQEVSDGKGRGLPSIVKRAVGQIIPVGFTEAGAFYYGSEQGMLDVYSARIDSRSGEILAPPEVIIKRSEGRNSWPDYSADGKHLAYLTTQSSSLGALQNYNFNILRILSLESGKEREFTSRLKQLAGTQWSPDSQFLYLTAGGDDHESGIYRVNAQTGEFSPIVYSQQRPVSLHRITPDGKTIIYVRRDEGWNKHQIIARNLMTGEEKKLYSGRRPIFSVSPDGQWLALISGYRLRFLRVLSLSEGWVKKDLTPFEEINFIRGVVDDFIEWTADGKYILFQKRSPVKGEMTSAWWRIEADSGELQQLDLPTGFYGSVSAHPDGQHIVFSALTQLNTTTGIWVMENFLPPAASTSRSKEVD